MERKQTCCFIGHRTLPRGVVRLLIPRITDGVSYLLDRKYRHFLLGGASGFDTVCARALLCMKLSGFNLDLHLALPCNDPNALASPEDREIYREVMKLAASVTLIEDAKTEERNSFLVTSSSACIAYVERAESDSAKTLRMAQSAGLTIYNLAPEIKKLSDLT